MATLATFTAGRRTFPIGSVLDAFPEARIEVERLVPTGAVVMPYFWVEGPTAAEVADALTASGGVENVVVVDTVNDRSLLRCDCPNAKSVLLPAIAASDVTLLSAIGTGSGWTVEVRGIERAAITAFDERCREDGVQLTLTEIHEFAADESAPGLTAAQQSALVRAYERGYYDEPRTCTLDEIAGDLGISRQALSSRLRRGYRALVESHVLDGNR
jgi:predicted DNA binding protein